MMILRRVLVGLLLMLGAGSVNVNAATREPKPVQWIRGIYVAESPAPVQVPTAVVQSLAQARARTVGGVAIRGTGDSMQPLYRDGVVMVVAPTGFNDLRRGQTVVYENEAGRTVAHVLVARCRTGWRVAGLNNRVHDHEGVNHRNLRGVVVEAFQPAHGLTVAAR